MRFTHVTSSGNTISQPPSPAPLPSGRLQGERRRDVIQLLPAIDPSHPNLLAHQQPKHQQLRRLGGGERTLDLYQPPELRVEPLDRVRGPQRLPLGLREAVEGQQLVSGFLQALHHLRRPGGPLGEESTGHLLGCRERLGIDDSVVGGPHVLQGMARDAPLQVPRASLTLRPVGLQTHSRWAHVPRASAGRSPSLPPR